MNYLDPNTGVTYTTEQLLALAGDTPLSEYIIANGYVEIDFSTTSQEEEVKIEDVVINNSATAASQNTAQTDTTDLDLDNVSLESLETPETPEEINKRDKYQAYYEEKELFEALTPQLKNPRQSLAYQNMQKELLALGPDFDLPATLYELDEDQFVDAFRKEFPGISIVQTDVGDGVVINVNGKDEYLDLQKVLPGESYYENFDKIIKDVITMDAEMTADNVMSGITAGIIYQMKDGEYNKNYVNETLKGTGYSIDQINKKGGRNTGMELLFNGEVVLQDTAVNNTGGKLDRNYIGNGIEEYLKNNLTPEQNAVVAEKSYKLLDVFLIKEAKEKAKVNDNLSEEKVKETYAANGFIPAVMTVASTADLDEAQKDILKTYLEQQQEKAVTIINTYGNTDYDYDYDMATSLAGLADVEGGSTILDALLVNDIVGQLEEKGLKDTRRDLVQNKMLTISERLLVDTGNEDLIRLAQNYRYAPVEMQQDAIDKKARNFRNSGKAIEDLLVNQLDLIGKTLPKSANLNYESVEFEGSIQRLFNLTLNEGATAEELDQFNDAQISFYKLQTNINRLQKDRRKSLHNIIEDINSLPDLNEITVVKDENGNEFEVNKNIYDLAFKEYDAIDLIAKDLSDATNQILLAAPTLLGFDSALDAQRQLNEKNKYYRSLGTYDDDQGYTGLFILRTLAQQFPNIALAIGTAGAGSVAGLGSIGTRLAIGTAFGTSSGAQTFRDLTLQQELVGLAYDQKNFLEIGYEKGNIDQFSYTQGLLDANQTIAMNELTDGQIIGASISNGIIEGGVTAALGTAPNAIKILKDFKGGINLVDMFAKKQYQQIAGILGEGAKRVGLEVLEEEIIYAGQGIITELAILEREFKGDQFDDVAITTIMVAGGSNGPGIAYSGINNMIYTNEFAKKVNKSNEQLIKLNKILADPTIEDDFKSVAIEAMGVEIGVKANAINVNSVDIMAMGEKAINDIIGFNALKNVLYDQAGVKRGTPEADALKLIEIYKESLSTEAKENFEDQISTVEQNISKLKDSPKDYDLVIKNLGDIHDLVVLKFNKNNPNWKNNLTKAEQLALVIEDIRVKARQDQVNRAKSSSYIVEEVEALRNNSKSKKGRKLTAKEKEIMYANYGRIMTANFKNALINKVETELSAEKLLTKEQLSSLTVIELNKDNSNAADYLNEMVENNEIENEAAVEILESLKMGANGFIVGNKYIVKDKKIADDLLLMGKIRSAVVINHEINHAIDNAYFKNIDGKLSTEGLVFVENLEQAMTAEDKFDLNNIDQTVRKLLDDSTTYGENKGRTFKNTTDKYKDEYAREVQSLLLANNYKLELETKESLITKIQSKLGFGLEINTPEKALDYIISNNAAFRKGELTSKVKKKIGKSLTSELNIYKKSITQLQTAEDSKPNKKRLFQQTVDTFNDVLGIYKLDLTLNPDGTANFTKADWDSVSDEDKLGIGKMVGETWTPFVDYLMQSRRDVPGYDEYAKTIVDRAATGVEKGDDGIPFLVKTFNPTKSKLTTHIFGNVAKRLQGVIENTSGFGQLTTDAAPTLPGSKQLVGKESADSRIDLENRKKLESKERKVKSPNLINKLEISNLDNSGIVTVKDKTETEIKRKIKQQFLLGSKTEQGSPEFRRELIQEYRADLSNLFISIIKEGLAFDTDSKIKNSDKILNINNFINNNVDEIIKNVTQNIDIANIKYSFLTELILDSNGDGIRKGAAESRAYNDNVEKGNIAGKKIKDIYSGPFRRKAKTITTELRNEFKDYFLGDMKTNKRNARIDSLADVLSEQTGFDLTGEVLREEGLLVEEKIQEIEKQISRTQFSIAGLDSDQQIIWENKRFSFYDGLRNAKNYKWPTINRIHRSIYSEEFTDETHEGISKQFSRLLGPLSKSDKQIFKSKKVFNRYLEDVAYSADINEILAAMVGTEKSIPELSADKVTVMDARRVVVEELFPNLVDKYDQLKAEELLLAYSTSFSQGQSLFGAFKIDKDGEVVLHNEINDKGKPKNRPSFYGNKADILALMQSVNEDIISIENKTITYKGGYSRKVDINTSATVLKSYIDGKYAKSKKNTKDKEGNTVVSLQNKNKKDAGLAWEFTKVFFETIKDVNVETKALMLAAMNGSTNSALRLAAPVWGKSSVMPSTDLSQPGINKRGETIMEAIYRYEHAIPARVVLFFMYDSIINGNKEIDLDILKEDYRVTIIPIKEMDKVLGDTGFSSMMLAGYLPGKQAWWKRYYNIFTMGRMPYALQSYADSKEVVGKKFENYYNKKNPPVVKANAQDVINQDRNSDKAMSNARNSTQYSISEKKIRVFDFDDTLARSNSKVTVTMPESVQNITNTGDAKKVINTVYKKVINSVANNSNINTISFSSEFNEKSRVKLYNLLANKLAKDLGWELDVFETVDSTGDIDVVTSEDFTLTKGKNAKKIKGDKNNIKFKKDIADNLKNSFNVNGKTYDVSLDFRGEGDYSLEFSLRGKSKGKTYKINATEFAEQSADLEAQGAIFNFDEFSKVIDGKKGPLFNVAKKIQDARGSEDIFVLTARPQEAAGPIKEFLASIGLNIPLENITGLADGRPEAKSDWIINKFSEGYNDFYFTDDAIKNVKAVKDVLDVLDVKSKVQQARVQFSENFSEKFNLMIEENKGVDANKRYSEVVAKRKGQNQKRWTLFIPPSADDFRGLTMYTFAGRGKKGEADQEFFDKALIKPYTRGIAAMEVARQQTSNDWRSLVASFDGMKKRLRKKIKGQEYTNDEAIRVYLWDKAGYTIPGISKRDQAFLSKLVREDPDLAAFADGVLLITKKENYIEPDKNWDGGTILSDLNNITKTVNRREYIKEFSDNVEVIFSPENLNKVEAIYGTRVRESLENSIYRMVNGTNRSSGTNDRIVNTWNNWVNNSVGAIMFFNRRSALLQLISSVNFVNWSDNNPAMAAVAFANQPQYWKDVARLFNSDKLKQRRSGLKSDVNEAEIAAAVKGATNKAQAFISLLLKFGFTPTQIADSVAISTGGATFYRNRINTYKKQGMTDVEAETKAFEDFSAISDESQQSADPMLISQQQAGVLGRLVLAFQNTPMQYTRLMKKAAQDLIAGRGDAKSHISKIVYYAFIQNLIFATLQSALFALIPGFEEDDDDMTEEERAEGLAKAIKSKEGRIINSMIDTILRGSGLAGAAIATIKNVIRTYNFQEQKGFTADHTYTIIEAINLSPPIGSKTRKIYSAIQTKKIERDAIAERGFDVTIDGKFNLSPSYQVVGDLTSAATNIPIDRLVAEMNAITEALDSRNTKWQRIALALGYRTWDVKAKNEEHDRIKIEGKARRKAEGKIKAKETRKATKDAKKKLLAEKKRLEEVRLAALTVEQRLQETKTKDSLTDVRIERSIEKALLRLDKMMQ